MFSTRYEAIRTYVTCLMQRASLFDAPSLIISRQLQFRYTWPSDHRCSWPGRIPLAVRRLPAPQNAPYRNLGLAFTYSFLELGPLYSWLHERFAEFFSTASGTHAPAAHFLVYPSILLLTPCSTESNKWKRSRMSCLRAGAAYLICPIAVALSFGLGGWQATRQLSFRHRMTTGVFQAPPDHFRNNYARRLPLSARGAWHGQAACPSRA